MYQAPPSLIGATLQAMVRIGSAMSKCTPLKLARTESAFCCIHSSNASRLPQLRVGSWSSACTASSTEPPGTMRCAVCAMSSSIRLSCLDTPPVRFLEVDLGTEEVTRLERVAVAADPIGLAAPRGQVGFDEPSEVGVRRRGPGPRPRPAGRASRRVPRRRGCRSSRPQRLPDRSSRGPGQPPRRTVGAPRPDRLPPRPRASLGSPPVRPAPQPTGRRSSASRPRWQSASGRTPPALHGGHY